MEEMFASLGDWVSALAFLLGKQLQLILLCALHFWACSSPSCSDEIPLESCGKCAKLWAMGFA